MMEAMRRAALVWLNRLAYVGILVGLVTAVLFSSGLAARSSASAPDLAQWSNAGAVAGVVLLLVLAATVALTLKPGAWLIGAWGTRRGTIDAAVSGLAFGAASAVQLGPWIGAASGLALAVLHGAPGWFHALSYRACRPGPGRRTVGRRRYQRDRLVGDGTADRADRVGEDRAGRRSRHRPRRCPVSGHPVASPPSPSAGAGCRGRWWVACVELAHDRARRRESYPACRRRARRGGTGLRPPRARFHAGRVDRGDGAVQRAGVLPADAIDRRSHRGRDGRIHRRALWRPGRPDRSRHRTAHAPQPGHSADCRQHRCLRRSRGADRRPSRTVCSTWRAGPCSRDRCRVPSTG